MTEIVSKAETLARYRHTMHARTARDAHALAERKRRALAVARQASTMLVDEFGATRVRLFGSLAHGRWFSATSDIDLAVWGVDPEAHLVALSRLEDLGGDLPIAVVRAEHCGAGLLAVIEEEGVAL
jgi:predicted nucleotidyltransferase